ncbi:MAG: RNA polymerase sigma factor [Saprospiraceae bacterium]|nr:RNA polymerase sigma factor [Saprospiraceae bacterium]
MALFEPIYNFLKLNPCTPYRTHELLFQGLAKSDSRAIQCLMLKSRKSVAFIVQKTGLSANYTEDVLNEAIVIFLKKIADKTYQFEGNAPTTYLLEIARFVALNFTRKSGFKPLESLDERHEHFDFYDEDQDIKMERLQRVEVLLNTLESPCREIIQLHYLDDFSDQEVVSRQLVPISSTGSLKARRSQCLKKLREMALDLKHNSVFL